MRSLAEIEQAFAQEAEADRLRQDSLRRQARQRTHQRRRDRVHKRGSLRFFALILVLLATAVAVTVAMFETLYIVMG